jgi:hypothetical protein
METFYSFLETPIGQLVTGALIAILISLVFSWWGTKQLRNATEKLRKLNILTIRILDEGNLLPPGHKAHKRRSRQLYGRLHSRAIGCP